MHPGYTHFPPFPFYVSVFAHTKIEHAWYSSAAEIESAGLPRTTAGSCACQHETTPSQCTRPVPRTLEPIQCTQVASPRAVSKSICGAHARGLYTRKTTRSECARNKRSECARNKRSEREKRQGCTPTVARSSGWGVGIAPISFLVSPRLTVSPYLVQGFGARVRVSSFRCGFQVSNFGFRGVCRTRAGRSCCSPSI